MSYETWLGNTITISASIWKPIIGAGTNANVFIQLFGEKGSTSKTALKQNENNIRNKFERNQVDIFHVETGQGSCTVSVQNKRNVYRVVQGLERSGISGKVMLVDWIELFSDTMHRGQKMVGMSNLSKSKFQMLVNIICSE